MSGIDEQNRRRPPRSERDPWLEHPSHRFNDDPMPASLRENRERRRAAEAERRKRLEKGRNRVKHREKVKDILVILFICVGLIPFLMGTYVFVTPSNCDTYDSYVDALGTFDRIEIYQNDMVENQLVFLADVYKDNDTITFAKLIMPDDVVRIYFEVTIGYITTIKETIMVGGESDSINLLDDIYVHITLSYPVVKAIPYVEWTLWGWSALISMILVMGGVLLVDKITYKWVREARHGLYL